MRDTPDDDMRPESSSAPPSRNMAQMAWQHKWLILLGLVLGLVVGSLVYSRTQPIYRSSAQLLVIKKRSDVVPLAGGDMTQSFLEDYVSTHIALLKAPAILDKAITKGNLAALKTFEGQGNPAGALSAGLVATRDATGTNRTIINLTFEGPVAEDTALVLDAVIESYTDFLATTYQNVSKDTENLYVQARTILKDDLAKREAEYRKFREGAPILWKTKDGANVHQVRVGEIEGKKSALIVRRAEIEGRIQAVADARKAGKLDPAILVSLTETKPDVTEKDVRRAHEDQLLPLLHEERELLEDYGEDHPRVRSVRARIASTRKMQARDLEPASAGQKQNKRSVAEELVDRYVRTSQHELAQIQASCDALDKLLASEREDSKKLSKFEIQDEEFRVDIGRTQQLYEQTIKRLQEVNLVRNFGGYEARVIAPAGLGARIAPSLTRTLGMAAALGLLAGLGLAYLAEITDKSFRSPEEIRRRLGLPIMAHIPFVSTSSKEANLPENGEVGVPNQSLCVFHRPTSLEAEAYRSLRTGLFFATKGSETKIIQITSPNMGDGKTTLAVNLAVAIAQSGKRVVIVDSDLRRPRIHRLFGLQGTHSITDVLTGDATVADAVQQTCIPGLSVLPCLSRPNNPAELLTTMTFERMLEELREQFDIVLVDSPPLLAVTDPCIVAGRVDGILLTIRVAKNGRPAAERAKEMLMNLDVPILGVIVNGTGKEATGGYGYGYKYYAYDEYSYHYRSDNATEREKPSDSATARN